MIHDPYDPSFKEAIREVLTQALFRHIDPRDCVGSRELLDEMSQKVVDLIAHWELLKMTGEDDE